MGALVNAAKHAKDVSTGGVRDQALAALVNQARQVIIAVPPEPNPQILSYARCIVRSASPFADQAAWAAATDPAVSASAVPTEAMINNAIIAAWPFLATIDNYAG